MSHLDPARKASTSELRKFGLLVGGAFLALAAVLFWRQKPAVVVGTLGTVGALLFVLGGVAPKALGPIYVGWMRFAVLLSRITTPIFMGVIYFVLLTPIGLLMRAFGRHPLRHARPGTAWVDRAPGARASSLERQF
jgi:hypothetical protein